MVEPAAAVVAGAAEQQRHDRDALARPRRAVTPAPTSTTSAENSWPRICGSTEPLSAVRLRRDDDRAHRVLVQVGAADAAPERAQQHLARAGRRSGRRPPRRGCRALPWKTAAFISSFQARDRRAPCPRACPEASRSSCSARSSSGCTRVEQLRARAAWRRGARSAGARSSPQTWARVVRTVISRITSDVHVDLLRAAPAGRPAARCRRARTSPSAASSWPGAPLASMTTSAPRRADRGRDPVDGVGDPPATHAGRRRAARARSSRGPGKSTTVRSTSASERRPGEHEGADRAGADEHDAVAVAGAGAPGGVQADGERLGQPGRVEVESPSGTGDEGRLGHGDELGHAAGDVEPERVVRAAEVGAALAGSGRTRRTRPRRRWRRRSPTAWSRRRPARRPRR